MMSIHVTQFRMYFFLLVLVSLIGCNQQNGPASIKVNSSSIPASEKKLLLEKYLSFRRNYVNLQYTLFFQNNHSGMIPAPNDWDICLLVKVPSEEMGQWVPKNAQMVFLMDQKWLEKIPGTIDYSTIENWYLRDKNILVGIDQKNSIIAYRNSSDPIVYFEKKDSSDEQKSKKDK